jgi:hypothetical protein
MYVQYIPVVLYCTLPHISNHLTLNPFILICIIFFYVYYCFAQIFCHIWLFILYTFLFFLYMFLANQRFISHNFLLCHPSQRSALSQVPSQVAPHQKIGSQLWAGETPDLKPGVQDNSQACYHWATMPPDEASYLHLYIVRVALLKDTVYEVIFREPERLLDHPYLKSNQKLFKSWTTYIFFI